MQAVARVGDPSPAGGTFAGSIFGDFWFNDAGQVAFQAVSQAGGVQRQGLFVGTATAPPLKVAAQGDHVLDDGTVVSALNRLKMNAAGQVAYVAELAGGTHRQGVFLGTGGNASAAIALEGDVAPGTPECVFSDFTFQDGALDVNSHGQVAFWAALQSCPIRTGFFVGSPTSDPTPLLLQGQDLPGGGIAPPPLPGSDVIALADSGESAMYVRGLDGDGFLPRFVIADRNGVLRRFAAQGDKAVGTGSVFGRLIPSITANSDGRFFFQAQLVDGPAKTGLFWNGVGAP